MGSIVRHKPWTWVALLAALTTSCAVRAERYQVAETGATPAAVPITSAPPASEGTAQTQLEQVVVLQDGGVMHGRVTRNGDRYVLARGTGKTFIPAGNVLLVAASLEDAYRQRRERMDRSTVDNHLVLAEWCFRHELIAHAEQELAQARALEPRHERLQLLERRIALAKERQHKEVVAARAAPAPQPVAPPPAHTDVGDLPPGAVERFTRKVQPVLVNSCTMSGCHELGGTREFQLDRAMLHGMSNRRTTMRNLAATLELVDREQPRLSPLLTVPRQTHGGMKEPVFGPRNEAAFRHLYEWVALVTAETAKPLPSATTAASLEPATDDHESALYQAPANAPIAQDGELESPAPWNALNAATPLQYGAKLEHWQPRDAFDPEIFNRKYSPRPAATANREASKPREKAGP